MYRYGEERPCQLKAAVSMHDKETLFRGTDRRAGIVEWATLIAQSVAILASRLSCRKLSPVRFINDLRMHLAGFAGGLISNSP
jgi:hypothetical protein